jgi:hypothetical protein
MFEIISDGTIIGRTKFEYGDPPMGAAFGKLIPTSEFAEFCASKPVSRPSNWPLRVWSDLMAMSADGVLLDGAIVTVKFVEPTSMEEGPEIEVSAEAIPSPLFREVFPHHVAEYEARFSDKP